MIKIINLIILSLLLPKFISSYNFLFSVIISIYNTGRYLEESIESVLNQTIKQKAIQIILINDGSTDETEEICLHYKGKYPDNIIYIKIVHSGVSRARNVGMEQAKGQYINFLDADDKWDYKAFKYVFLFLRYYKKINIVGCRLIFFESKRNNHPLDYKFYKTRVANLTEEYNCIQLSSSSSFFRHSLIKKTKFEEGVITGEDTRFINNILLMNPLLGIIKEAIYYYRKRADSTSTVQNQVKNEKFYFSVIKSVNHYLIERSKKLYNTLVPFIQFWLAYDILFRIASPSYKYLEKSKLNEYYKLIEGLLKQIDDKYILEQKILSAKEKLIALSKKYHYDIRNDLIIKEQSFIYSGKVLVDLNKENNILELKFLNIKNNIIHLEGKDNCLLNRDKFFFFCTIKDKIFYPDYFNYSGYDLITIYENIYKGRNVVFNIPLEDRDYQIVQFFISYKGQKIEIFPSLGKFTHIPNTLNGYYTLIMKGIINIIK